MAKRAAPPGTYWRGNILWGRCQIAGKEYKWSLRTGDAAIAKRRRQAEKDRLTAEVHFGERRHTYQAVFDEWSLHIVTQVGPKTSLRYARSLKMMEPELTPLFIDQIAKLTVNDIVKRRRLQGAATPTIRRDLTALSSVLNYAADQDYREGNPALDALRKLKERRKLIPLAEHSHINQVIALSPPMLAAIAIVALGTGCREDELATAERACLDLARRQLTVTGKGNKRRTVEITTQAAIDALRALPTSLGCRWLFWHDEDQPYSSLASNHRRVIARAMRSAQKAAQAKKLKEPDFRAYRFHDYRHRFAVDWLKSGRSIYDLQHQLGHTSIKTTEIYLEHLAADEVRIVKGQSPQKPAQEHGLFLSKTA